MQLPAETAADSKDAAADAAGEKDTAPLIARRRRYANLSQTAETDALKDCEGDGMRAAPHSPSSSRRRNLECIISSFPSTIGSVSTRLLSTIFSLPPLQPRRSLFSFSNLEAIQCEYPDNSISMNSKRFLNISRPHDCEGPRVLLVTAHPDDETLFFAPLLLRARDEGAQVAVLCLSTGNSEGLGAVRVAELHRAAVILGVETSPHDSISPSQVCKGGSRVEAIDHAELQDGMRASWPPQAVRDLVMDRVRSFRPDIVVTFDEGGVSGHPNHIDTYRGVQLCARDYNAERGGKTDYPSILFLKLHTTCLVRKYAGAMDALLTAAVLQSSCWPLDRAPDRSNDDDNDVILVLNPDVPIVYAAMAQHRSQFVWYRRAFVLLSRYTYINTFRRIR